MWQFLTYFGQKLLSYGANLHFLNGPFPASVFFIFVFSIQLTANKCSINFADDWIRTADLVSEATALPTEPHTTAHINTY